MPDIDAFMAAYQNQQKAIAEASAINKSAVFDALAATEITSISVTFDGESDSGQIGEITAFAGGNPHPLPAIQIEIQHVPWGGGKRDSSRSPLRDAIETLCYDYLSQKQSGWEDNEGGFGSFAFDVARRSIALEFNGRYSDYTTSHYTF